MKRKTALVTGSSEGLGRAILLRLAAEGANVVINYHRNETAAKEVKTAAEAEGVRAIVVQADVSSVPDIPAHSQVAWPGLYCAGEPVTVGCNIPPTTHYNFVTNENVPLNRS